MRTARSVVVVVLAALVAGCSAANGQGKAATGSRGSAPPGAVISYLTAVASHTPDGSRAGLPFAAPGSPAFQYLQYFAFVADAAADAGKHDPPARVAPVSPSSVDVCDGDSYCGRFSDFAFDARGRVTDFTADGAPFSAGLVIGAKTLRVGGARVAFDAAYKASPGNLHVLVTVTAGAGPIRLAANPRYARRGATSTPVFALGPRIVAAHQQATFLWAFADADLGGTFTVGGCTATACAATRWQARFDVRRPDADRAPPS